MTGNYLRALWDEMAKIVLQNSRDFDARDESYPTQVSAVVWQTVRQLRKGRQTFRAEIRRELKAKRR